jgi:hypothetical protein
MKISDSKKDKISEQILETLYHKSPQPLFTSHIAKEIARDEEFVKQLLLDLDSKKLVLQINKNPKGKEYSKRIRWKLSDFVYSKFKQKQQGSKEL